MTDPIRELAKHNIPTYLGSYSALEKYFGYRENNDKFIYTDASLFELAREFEEIQYPGYPLSDAVLVFRDNRYIFKCLDSGRKLRTEPFTVLELLYEPQREVFLDPMGIYHNLREDVLVPENMDYPNWVILFEAAKLVSKFHYSTNGNMTLRVDGRDKPPEDCQRELLIGVLSGKYPNKGFSLLLKSGFIEEFWPEIFIMTETSHSKDYHPEGNVWEHTLEALKFRKKQNIELSLALLLHDIGKAYSVSYGDKPFYNHSIVGTRIARKFLRRLKFPEETIENVLFLIKHHMFPHAMIKMPPYRREKIMESELFPMLLEVYRADISSSYNELDNYYEACRIYKNYLRERKNPFKSLKSVKLHRPL